MLGSSWPSSHSRSMTQPWLLLAAIAALVVAQSAATLESFRDAATDLEPWIIEKQQELHKIPELMFDTPLTYKVLEKTLKEIGVKHWRPKSGIGLIAEIGSGSPVVVLRSDIDALPITEAGTAKIKSMHEGKAHMCGHDGHMSMLLAGAKLLHDVRSSLKGTARLVFQPAEEGGAGGDVMIKEGALDGAAAAFGFHVMPHIPSGTIGSRAGTIMAAASVLKIVVTGRGGHAAMPHTTRDPVVASSAIVLALQSLISRETDPLKSAVISITKTHGGTAFNVIPDTVTLEGTLRTLTDESTATLKQRVEEVAEHQAASYGCTAEVNWRTDVHPYYPACVNDKETNDFASDVATRLLGEKRVDRDTAMLMAGEDFAFFTRAIPSAFLFLGIRNETLGSIHALHNSKFILDQTALKTGAAMHAALASEFLAKAARKSGSDEL